MNNIKSSYGFTLVELIVVITIIAVFLSFAIPVFNRGGFFSNPGKEAGSLVRLIQSLKTRAVRENQDLFLHVDTRTNQLWITNPSMDETAVLDARETPLDIPGRDFQIVEIEFPGGHDKGDMDHAVIRFSKKGYSDMVIVHGQSDSGPVSLRIEPFSADIFVVFDRVSFHDCR